jgi:MFS family permease
MSDPVTDKNIDQPAASVRSPWYAFSAIAISFVVGVASSSMIPVALAQLADEFEVTLRSITWVVIIQGLTLSAVMMPMGRLADIIGRRKVHLLGLVIFGTGAIVTSLAPVFVVLLVARVVSAVGNSMMQSVGTAMMISVFPDSERGKALGMQSTMVAIGLASGPVFAGIMLQFFDWRIMFMVITSLIVVSFIAGLVLIDERVVSRNMPAGRPPFDWVGAIVSAVSIVIVVVLINNPFGFAVLSPMMIGGTVSAIALLVFFVRWEIKSDSPMLELRLFQNRAFSLAVLARISGFMALTAFGLLTPIYLIGIRGIEEALAGGILFIASIGMGFAAQASGRLSDRFSERPFILFGFTTLTVAALMFSTYSVDTPVWVLMAMMFVNGLGFGMWTVPNNSVIMSSVSRRYLGVVGALTNLVRNVGLVAGQAIATTIVVGLMISRGFNIPLGEVAEQPDAVQAFMDGWRIAFMVVAAFSATAFVLSYISRPQPIDE